MEGQSSLIDLQLKSSPASSDWQTINFRKLRQTLSSPFYTSFPQWTEGNYKSLARHLRVIALSLRAPDEEVTLSVNVEGLDKGSNYVPYSADDYAIFLASTPANSRDEPNYEIGTDEKPGPRRWQRSQLTVKGDANIFCSIAFRMACRSVRIRISAILGEHRSEREICFGVCGGSTQSVEQSRKRQLPSSATTSKRKTALLATAQHQPHQHQQQQQQEPSLPRVASHPLMNEQLLALQKLLWCGQWQEFDQRASQVCESTLGLDAHILLSCRYMHVSSAAELADPHHQAWREFTKGDHVLQGKNLAAETKYLSHLLTLYRKARLPFVGSHQAAFERLSSLVQQAQSPTPDLAAARVALALAPSPSLDEEAKTALLQQAIHIYCQMNRPDELAHTVITLCSVRMSRKPREGVATSDPLSHIPPGPWTVLGPEYEQTCCDLRQLNHKVMSLLTQADYWLVWADVLTRGGRIALATQMCMHCIKVAESVHPPFTAKSAAAKERLVLLRSIASAPPSRQGSEAILPAALLLELGLHEGSKRTSSKTMVHSHAHASTTCNDVHKVQSPHHRHNHGHSNVTPHQAHIAADPHGHLHSGHVHAELHLHSGHVHSHHTHGKGLPAILSPPPVHTNHAGAVCSHSSSELAAGSCVPCSAENAPVCMEDIHCDGECCELLDWEIQLASCCCSQNGRVVS